MSVHIDIDISKNLSIKDPFSSELGKKIVLNGLSLINHYGFEDFNFKKLAVACSTTEASVYRYFNNKVQLLAFLTAYYWNWTEYLTEQYCSVAKSPKNKLSILVNIICNNELDPGNINGISYTDLHQLITCEWQKLIYNKETKLIPANAAFEDYKRFKKMAAVILTDINKNIKEPQAIITTLIIAANTQLFFSKKFQSLSSIQQPSKSKIVQFIYTTALKLTNHD